MPEECYELVKRNLVEQRDAPVYQRVTMTLGQILDGAFFLEYMKKGNYGFRDRNMSQAYQQQETFSCCPRDGPRTTTCFRCETVSDYMP